MHGTTIGKLPTFWMIGRRVAASRLLTIRKYPVAGVVLVSTIPKTH
jgi:hypothetical protein